MKKMTFIAGAVFLLALVIQPATAAATQWDILGYHVVQSGETLFCIGRAYGVSPRAIATQNQILSPSRIYPGTKLAIPAVYATLPAGPVCERQFGTEPPLCNCVQTYRIARGDTLTRIAWRFGLTPWRIAECNRIYNLNYIRAGDTLCIPPPLPDQPTPPPPTATSTPPPPAPTPTPTSPPSPTATPTSTPEPATPTPTASPTPTAPPGEQPAVVFFRASVTEADPGDTITLEWESTGATEAALYYILPTGQYSRSWDVEPTGTMAYTISPDHRNAEYLQLSVWDEAARAARAWLTIELRCPDEWFFSPAPDECPSGPALRSDGAEQHFEHGVMLWVGAEDRIYVLFEDGVDPEWYAFADEWDPGEPESDPGLVPPTGHYQPVRGFGLVWREQTGVRDRLGWAVEEEVGYETAVQRTARFKYNLLYIRARDGGAWELGPEMSEWRHIP